MKIYNDKYLRLNGYPLAKPLWQTFHQSAAFQTTIASTALTIGSLAVHHGTDHLPQSIAAGLAIGFLGTFKYEVLQNYGIYNLFADKGQWFFQKPRLAIDTEPSPNVRTSPLQETNARWMRGVAFAGTAVYSGGVAFLLAKVLPAIDHSVRPVEICEGVGLMGQLVAPALIGWASCTSRFNKVVKGEYAIVETPPQPVLTSKTKTAAMPNAVFT